MVHHHREKNLLCLLSLRVKIVTAENFSKFMRYFSTIHRFLVTLRDLSINFINIPIELKF